MKRWFTLSTLAEVSRQCLRRFPITVVFTTLLTVYLLVTLWVEEDLFKERVDVALVYYLAVGILLTTVLQLWGEEIDNRRKRVWANGICHLALLADAVYIYSIYDNSGWEVFLAHASAITALTLCMFILPFFREKDDVASWNFTLRLVIEGPFSFLIGSIMCGGICLLTEAVESLFDINLSYKWNTTWCILFLQTLPILLFLGRIPDGEEKHDHTLRVSTFSYKSIRFLFLPLLGCYLLVLYGYLAKIILQWQLPDGWVSGLVSVLTFGSIAVILGLYPSLRQGTSKTDSRLVRYLPLLILPLVVLMTIGIMRRLDDYGVTVKRLYLLTLNIWFYVVCIGLYVTRSRRLSWIAISFAAFFLLTSVLPVNITRFTCNWIYNKVETALKDSYKGKLPMNEENYLNWLDSLPVEEAKLANSRLEYLDSYLNDKSTKALVADSISWWKAKSSIDKRAEIIPGNTASSDICYINGNRKGVLEIDSLGSYSSMLVFNNYYTTASLSDGQKFVIPIKKDKKTIDYIEISLKDVRKWGAMTNFTYKVIPCRNKGNRFMLTYFYIYNKDKKTFNFTYSGYYLMKE